LTTPGATQARLVLLQLIAEEPMEHCPQPPRVVVALDYDGVLHHHMSGPDRRLVARKPFNRGWFVGELKRACSKAQADRARDASRSDRIDCLDVVGVPFDRAVHLEQLLNSRPHAGILITTSWRSQLTLNQLKGFLPRLARNRAIGVIPWDVREKSDRGVRGELVEAWLRSRALHALRWIALDDQADHYAKHSNHLIKVPYRGLDENCVQEALTRL